MDTVKSDISVDGVVKFDLESSVPRVYSADGTYYHLRSHTDSDYLNTGDIIFSDEGRVTKNPTCPQCDGHLFVGEDKGICTHCEIYVEFCDLSPKETREAVEKSLSVPRG